MKIWRELALSTSPYAMIGLPEEMSCNLTHRKHNVHSITSRRAVVYKQKRVLKEIQLPKEVPLPSLGRISPSRVSCSEADKGRLIIVEGNIGVGKTTLARKLSFELRYKLFLEPTVENPYLEKFYAEPNKYALPLQLWILRQRYQTYLEAAKHIINTGDGAILDRSVYSDIVFANVCNREGYITEAGYSQYQYWRQRALESLPIPHVTLFLDATPECCHSRIHKRGRECEGGVPIDYLTKLHTEYLEFCQYMKSLGSAVVQCDWSEFKCEKQIIGELSTMTTSQWSNRVTQDFILKHDHITKLFDSTVLDQTHS